MKRGAPKSDPEKVRAFVERGRRSSAESLSPGETKRRKPMKRSQPRRDWDAARRKVGSEGMCRHCGADSVELHAAHIVGREHDQPKFDSEKGVYLKTLWVNPNRVVPLCARCHRRYDPHTRGLDEIPADLLPSLTFSERAQAFADCDYDAIAYLERVTNVRWIPQGFGPLEGVGGL